MKINVGILFGGKSVEHDISIITALQIYENIDKNKYNVIPLYLNHNNEIYTGKKYFELETYKKPIKDKPYIKVANYYREVDVTKKGDEFFVTPKKGEETKLENIKEEEVTQISLQDFYKRNFFNNKQIDISMDKNR